MRRAPSRLEAISDPKQHQPISVSVARFVLSRLHSKRPFDIYLSLAVALFHSASHSHSYIPWLVPLIFLRCSFPLLHTPCPTLYYIYIYVRVKLCLLPLFPIVSTSPITDFVSIFKFYPYHLPFLFLSLYTWQLQYVVFITLSSSLLFIFFRPLTLS